MLEIFVEGQDFFNEETEEYIDIKGQLLVLEHSLLSLHKWEQKWEIYFLDNEQITTEQFIDYIRCMTINKVDPLIYSCLTEQNIKDIRAYMNRKMTATTFRETPGAPGSRKIMTAEVIYSRMISYGIPKEFEKWHLGSLFTLIRVCAEDSNPKKKMSRRESAQYQRDLNATRRKQHGKKG